MKTIAQCESTHLGENHAEGPGYSFVSSRIREHLVDAPSMLNITCIKQRSHVDAESRPGHAGGDKMIQVEGNSPVSDGFHSEIHQCKVAMEAVENTYR